MNTIETLKSVLVQVATAYNDNKATSQRPGATERLRAAIAYAAYEKTISIEEACVLSNIVNGHPWHHSDY